MPATLPRSPATPASAEHSYRMKDLCERTGLPRQAIHFYIQQGLLPQGHKTGRNMAYYDVALVPRIQRIKELQRTRFLPLKVIKSVLDESELDSTDETAASAIARALSDAGAQGETRRSSELLAGGMPQEQLSWLRQMGVIQPLAGFDEDTYGGDDLELLRVLAAARKSGITSEMLPITIVGEYAAALRELVRVEMRLFREGVLPRASLFSCLRKAVCAAIISCEPDRVLRPPRLSFPAISTPHRLFGPPAPAGRISSLPWLRGLRFLDPVLARPRGAPPDHRKRLRDVLPAAADASSFRDDDRDLRAVRPGVRGRPDLGGPDAGRPPASRLADGFSSRLLERPRAGLEHHHPPCGAGRGACRALPDAAPAGWRIHLQAERLDRAGAVDWARHWMMNGRTPGL